MIRRCLCSCSVQDQYRRTRKSSGKADNQDGGSRALGASMERQQHGEDGEVVHDRCDRKIEKLDVNIGIPARREV